MYVGRNVCGCVLHRSNRGVDTGMYEVTEETLVKSGISAGNEQIFTCCNLLMSTLC